jgi:hypothetical protein
MDLLVIFLTTFFFNPLQAFFRTREVREFASGALAGAMSKAILAPLETIRYSILLVELCPFTHYEVWCIFYS